MKHIVTGLLLAVLATAPIAPSYAGSDDYYDEDVDSSDDRGFPSFREAEKRYEREEHKDVPYYRQRYSDSHGDYVPSYREDYTDDHGSYVPRYRENPLKSEDRMYYRRDGSRADTYELENKFATPGARSPSPGEVVSRMLTEKR